MFGNGIVSDILFGWIWPVLLGVSSKLVGNSGEGIKLECLMYALKYTIRLCTHECRIYMKFALYDHHVNVT